MLELKDYRWMPKAPAIPRFPERGNQITLDYGKYHLSIIDDGYGREQGLYEIAVYEARDGTALGQIELTGITEDGDTVKGFLSEADVTGIINKMYWITQEIPEQI